MQVYSERDQGLWSQTAVVWILSPVLSSGVIWGELFYFPIPQFPHL